MTNLNTANLGQNKFCGPAVLSILTGKSTDECARVISRVNGQYNIVGVELKHLLIAAEQLGFDNKVIQPAGTLYGTLMNLSRNGDGMYIVTVPNHFVAIEVNDKRIYFCDNHTKEPIPAAASARLLQKVLAVNQVFKRPEVIIPKPLPKPVVDELKPTPELTIEDEMIVVLDGLSQGYRCWCEVAIDNPMYTNHTKMCETTRKLYSRLTGS